MDTRERKSLLARSLKLMNSSIIFCLLLVGCAKQSTTPASPTNIYHTTVNSFTGSSVYTYEELVERSDLILLGRITEKAESFNTSRNPENISQPHPGTYSIGQIYGVAIDKTIKGDAKGQVYVVNREGMKSIVEKSTPDVNVINAEAEPYRLAADTPYLMFLSRCCQGASGHDIPARDYYSGAGEPWLFILPEDPGAPVTLKSPWVFADQYFPPITLDEMLAYIANPALAPDYSKQFLPTAYPPPTLEATENVLPYP